jgi:hypothetical protein
MRYQLTENPPKPFGDARKVDMKMKDKSGFANESRNVKRVVGLLVCDASMRGALVRWFIGTVMKL